MQRLREKLVAGMTKVMIYIILVVAPRPPRPPANHFTITEPKYNLDVEMWFRPGTVWRMDWHVCYLLTFQGGESLLVDAPIGKTWITPVGRDRIAYLRRLLKPEIVVTAHVNMDGRMDLRSSIGPVTCVTLAKRLLGVHNPGIVTSRQLLDMLWRLRDGN